MRRQLKLGCRCVSERLHLSSLRGSLVEYRLGKGSWVESRMACCCCCCCGLRRGVDLFLLGDVDGLKVVGKICLRLEFVVVDGILIEVVHLVKVEYMAGREYQIRSRLWHLGLFRLPIKDSLMV